MTVFLNTSSNYNISMWIIVNAIFEARSLHTYLVSPYQYQINPNCVRHGEFSLGRSDCFSIHTNFTGSWTESEEVCRKKSSSLWFAKDSSNWLEVMRSDKFDWYLDEALEVPIQ